MNNAKTFGIALAKIRKEQGFSSAYNFFKNIGGSKSLGIAFISYWDMERGKKLPKSWRLKEIMAALGLDQHSAGARELVRAYFKALSGSDDLIQILASVGPSGNLSGNELAEAATHKALAQLSVNLTLEQWKLRSRDIATHICQVYLGNTSGWVTVQELSKATGFNTEEIKKTLKALASAGLADFSKDKARNRLEGKVIQLLPFTAKTEPVRAALRKYWKTWLEGAKHVAFTRRTVRMSNASLALYRQHLEKAVNLCEVYSNPAENRQDSAVYLIDGGIVKVIPRN